MTSRSAVRQATITRAAKAMRAAGETSYKIEIAPSGVMVIWAGDVAQRPSDNSFDRLISR